MVQQQRDRSLRIDEWLAAGGQVIAANERGARSATAAFHASRVAEGKTAWPTPAIFAWDGWVRERWAERESSGALLLNSLQERALWEKIFRNSRNFRDVLHPDRLAAAAQQAYRLLSNYAPESLNRTARSAWTGDSAIFSDWLRDFDHHCRSEALISASRLPLELAHKLNAEATTLERNSADRPPLLLIGFDRLLDTQQALLKAWGHWQTEALAEPATTPYFFAAQDAAAELAACVRWLRERLADDPQARLMIVTPSLAASRGQLERALTSGPINSANPHHDQQISFEFSLGVPLAQVSLARSGLLLLRWLHDADTLSEAEVDWLISSGHSASSAEEHLALAETMHGLRRKGMQRTEWNLAAFLGADDRSEAHPATSSQAAFDFDALMSQSKPFFKRPTQPPSAWRTRLRAASLMLRNSPAKRLPIEWVELTEQLLATAGWPGFRPLSSTAFQVRERWEAMLDNCATLGFDGNKIEWPEFIEVIRSTLSETIFATESSNASVLIAEPFESAGQLADAVWFLGVNEASWPGRGSPHPLLPIRLQRSANMPHSTPQADWELAQQATKRLLASSAQLIFSYARNSADSEGAGARPSRVALKLVDEIRSLPTALPSDHRPITELFDDRSRIAFPLDQIKGGAATLTQQSHCPFKAFSIARMGSEEHSPAEAGLNAMQRGQLLHEVLHRAFTKSAGGLSGFDALKNHRDIGAFVKQCVAWVFKEKLPAGLGEILPEKFLQLEGQRLINLVTQWLAYERGRQGFDVFETEASSQVTVADVSLNVRMDRVDLFKDRTKLVIDYKTGSVGSKAWQGERPDDVQLPLYAAFAIKEKLGGLVVARIKPGDMEFDGRVHHPQSLRRDCGKRSAIGKSPLTPEQIGEWHAVITRLAEDFLAGRAEVDPKDGEKTCDKCYLHAVCRIYENQSLVDTEVDEDEEEQAEGSDVE